MMPLSSQVSVRQTISGLRSTHSIFKKSSLGYKLLTLNRRRIIWDIESEGLKKSSLGYKLLTLNGGELIESEGLLLLPLLVPLK